MLIHSSLRSTALQLSFITLHTRPPFCILPLLFFFFNRFNRFVFVLHFQPAHHPSIHPAIRLPIYLPSPLPIISTQSSSTFFVLSPGHLFHHSSPIIFLLSIQIFIHSSCLLPLPFPETPTLFFFFFFTPCHRQRPLNLSS